MSRANAYQVKREDLTDAEYARVSRIFEFMRRIKAQRRARSAQEEK